MDSISFNPDGMGTIVLVLISKDEKSSDRVMMIILCQFVNPEDWLC